MLVSHDVNEAIDYATRVVVMHDGSVDKDYLVNQENADAEKEAVPTLLKVPKWVKIIKPLFDFLAISPGYNELDVSGAVMIFFTIFFGILIGDAGYGMVFFLISLYKFFILFCVCCLIIVPGNHMSFQNVRTDCFYFFFCNGEGHCHIVLTCIILF